MDRVGGSADPGGGDPRRPSNRQFGATSLSADFGNQSPAGVSDFQWQRDGCYDGHDHRHHDHYRLVRHIEHAVKVAGIEHVGIGCDFDGGGGFPGLNSVADYPAITAALLARGWSEAALTKLWGGNTFRLLN